MLPQLSDSAIFGQHVDHTPFWDHTQHMAGKWEGAGCGGEGEGEGRERVVLTRRTVPQRGRLHTDELVLYVIDGERIQLTSNTRSRGTARGR